MFLPIGQKNEAELILYFSTWFIVENFTEVSIKPSGL